MKKLLAIALIAASFTACSGDKKTDETTTVGSDTTISTMPSAPDTVKTVTDTMVKTTTITKDGDNKMSDTTKMNKKP